VSWAQPKEELRGVHAGRLVAVPRPVDTAPREAEQGVADSRAERPGLHRCRQAMSVRVSPDRLEPDHLVDPQMDRSVLVQADRRQTDLVAVEPADLRTDPARFLVASAVQSLAVDHRTDPAFQLQVDR